MTSGSRSQQFAPIARTFRHGNWVRAESGSYKGDLALVWEPKRPNVSVDSDELTVLVVPRLGAPGEKKPTKLAHEADNKRQRLRPRYPPLRVTEHLIQQARILGERRYEKSVFMKGLLVTQMKRKVLERTVPTHLELQPFSEAEFNVRAWHKALSQQTLRRGDRVIVTGGAENGVVGAFWTSYLTKATIIPTDGGRGSNSGSDAGPRVVEVDLAQLERHFLVGDHVKRMCTIDDEQEVTGHVVSVVDKGSREYVEECKERRRAAYKAFNEDMVNDEEIKARRAPPSIAPDSMEDMYRPRYIDITILVDKTLVEVSMTMI